jgi:hypothetical protein
MSDSPAPLTANSRLQAVETQVSADLGHETVILHLDSGIYFGLDKVGTRVWNLLAEPRTVAELRDAVVAGFEVDAATCEADLLRLLEQLRERGLVRVALAQ